MRAFVRLLPVVLVCLGPPRAHAEPDLVPELYGPYFEYDAAVGAGDVAEGCAGATDGRTLLRFGVRFHNVGDQALVVGNPMCPDCLANPGVVCSDSRFVCSPADGHNHPHYLGFARYELLDERGEVIAVGSKRSFCVRDVGCVDGLEPETTCTDQGLTAGCWDDYESGLGCQYVDVTELPDLDRRPLTLRVVLDPDATLAEGDRTNNVATLDIAGCGNGRREGDEVCDDGPDNTDGVCCRATCCTSSCRPVDGTPGCRIEDACITPGTFDDTGCLVCDPARNADGWSPYVAADERGLRCQLAACAIGAEACVPRTRARIARRVERLGRLLDRASSTGRWMPARRFAEGCGKLERLAARRACLAEEAATLAREAKTFAAGQTR